MSAFIFILILVTLAQCRAQGRVVIPVVMVGGTIPSPIIDTLLGNAPSFGFGATLPVTPIEVLFGIDSTNLTPIYYVTSNTVPDNSIEAQQYICPGFRSVWGEYQDYTRLCFGRDNTGYTSYYTLINDPAPAGFMTKVEVKYSTVTSCVEKTEPFQITASVEEQISTCNQFLDGDFTTTVLTKTPFPQDEASPLGLPTQLLKEVREDSQLFARYSTYSPSPNDRNATCASELMYWFTTGECLKEFSSGAFVYTFDNFQFYNENFYEDGNCTIQRRDYDSVSFLINQCLNYLGFGYYTTFPKPVIFEGVSSESSESSEDSQNPPGQGLGAIIFHGSNAEESGDTDGVSTIMKVVASVSACVVFVAAVAMYFKGRYCVRKESQETDLNLDDVAVVIA